MTQVVKILVDDDGNKISKEDQVWHYIMRRTGSQTLCGGEYFGIGESAVKYKLKNGKVTCPLCLEIINELKKY